MIGRTVLSPTRLQLFTRNLSQISTSFSTSTQTIIVTQKWRNKLSLTNSTISRMLRRKTNLERIYSFDVDSDFENLAHLQHALQLSDSQLVKLVIELPQLPRNKNTISSLEFFQSQMSFSQQELKKLFLKNPSLLGYNVATKIEPKISFFKRRLNLNNAHLITLLLRNPNLFTLKIQANVGE